MSTLRELKNLVLETNKELPKRGVVIYSWGNVSVIDRKQGIIVIKPAGVAYEKLSVDDISVTDLNGNILEGKHKPSVDLPIHIVLYEEFENVNAIAHTHSSYATQWAQAGRCIPAYGTTHADYFWGDIPCTRPLTESEVRDSLEVTTGKSIIELFADKNPLDLPGVLVADHGVFSWATEAWTAVHNVVVMEEIAKMAFGTEVLHYVSRSPKAAMPPYLLEKHFTRKHGPNAYFEEDDMGEK